VKEVKGKENDSKETIGRKRKRGKILELGS
jgi:hypothetical protein